MLGLLVRALRKHGPPDALYLDNGATYRGETLATACARIGTAFLDGQFKSGHTRSLQNRPTGGGPRHAVITLLPRPYDAPARGKMERFWRTLREGCLDFLAPDVTSLHDVNVRLWAFLDTHYHQSAHAALMGQTPWGVFCSFERKAEHDNSRSSRATSSTVSPSTLTPQAPRTTTPRVGDAAFTSSRWNPSRRGSLSRRWCCSHRCSVQPFSPSSSATSPALVPASILFSANFTTIARAAFVNVR
jgi:hypothetical protein